MACGAAVIAGDNSSQPEAASDAALLVKVEDPSALASGLVQVLTSPALAQDLRSKGPAQARRFSWDSVALKTLDVLQSRDLERDQNQDRPTPVPRVAFFTTGDAPGTESLLDDLARVYRVDLFHEPGHHPSARFQARDRGCYDARLFERIDRFRPFDAA